MLIIFGAYHLRSSDALLTIILKFKTFIYNTKRKIICYFCTHDGYTPPIRGEVTRLEKKHFTNGIFIKNILKYAKLMVKWLLMVKPYICDNLNEIYRFVYFQQKNFEIQSKKSSARQQTDFIHTYIIMLCFFFNHLHYI